MIQYKELAGADHFGMCMTCPRNLRNEANKLLYFRVVTQYKYSNPTFFILGDGWCVCSYFFL